MNFSTRIYENPELRPAEGKKFLDRMEKKYRPWVDYDGVDYLEERTGLLAAARPYLPQPFYYIDYCLAQLCAFQFWSQGRNDFKTAWQDYLRLCKAGGSQSFLELVKLANIQSPFDTSLFHSYFGNWELSGDSVDDRSL